MIKWIWQTFIWPPYCDHDWEKLTETSVYDRVRSDLPVNKIYLYRCKKCGTGRKYKLQ